MQGLKVSKIFCPRLSRNRTLKHIILEVAFAATLDKEAFLVGHIVNVSQLVHCTFLGGEST